MKPAARRIVCSMRHVSGRLVQCGWGGLLEQPRLCYEESRVLENEQHQGNARCRSDAVLSRCPAPFELGKYGQKSGTR